MYETGLERCGENLTDSGPASTKGESMRYKLSGEFQVVQVTLGRCQEAIGR